MVYKKTGSQNIQQQPALGAQQGLMALRNLHSTSAPLLPTPTTVQAKSGPPPHHQKPISDQIKPSMSVQPPTHMPPSGFPRSMPPPRYGGPPSIPPPGPVAPSVPKGPPPMGYSAYPTNGMSMMTFGNQVSSAAGALVSHPVLQQRYLSKLNIFVTF